MQLAARREHCMRALVNLTHDDAVKSEWSWLSVSVVSSLLTTITSVRMEQLARMERLG